jgi:hypothetical protein
VLKINYNIDVIIIFNTKSFADIGGICHWYVLN